MSPVAVISFETRLSVGVSLKGTRAERWVHEV